MEDIQNKAINTYTKNLEFLKNYDNTLYERIINLSYFIETNQYKERYSLEYIQEENEFDIYDTITNTFLYNKKPTEFIKKAVKNTNFDKSNAIMLLNDRYYNNINKIIIPENYDPAYSAEPYIKNDISDYTCIFNESTYYKKKEFKYIIKFMFIGTLLGSHIIPIHNKIKSNVYFIGENNLEIFRLSLFVTNYSALAKISKLIFSIMDEKEDLFKKLKLYHDHFFHSNYMFKYYSSNYNIQDFFDRILEFIMDDDPFTYPYPTILNTLLSKSFENMNKYPTVSTSYVHEILKEQNVLLLAAGPSFDKNLEWIKKYQNNFFIVAISSVVIKLIENGIEPDLITSADSKYIVIEGFPDKIKNKYCNIPFLAANATNKEVFKQFNKDNIFLYEVMSYLKKTSTFLIGASVTVQTLHLLYILGAKKINLLGVDLSYDSETGASHMSNYVHNLNDNLDMSEEKYQKNNFMKDNSYSRATTFSVKGNFRDQVITDGLFQRSTNGINHLNRIYKENTTIYNLSDGVYLEHTLTRKPEELNFDTRPSSINFLEFLKEHSTKSFTKEEREIFKNSVEFINQILLKISEIENIKVKKYQDFLIQRETLFLIMFQESLNYKNFFLNRLFSNYLLITEPYLEYIFNSEIKNEVNLIKKTKKIWISHIRKICNEYKKIVEKELV